MAHSGLCKTRNNHTAPTMITTTITDAEIADAEAYQRIVLANLAKRPRPNYTGFETPNRYRNGRIAEIKFRQVLEGRGIRFDHVVDTSGRSAPIEFTIYYKGQPLTCDVKSHGSLSFQGLRVNEDQYQRALKINDTPRYYIPAHLDTTLVQRQCEFRGYAKLEQLANAIPAKGSLAMMRIITRNHFHDIQNMLSQADKGAAVITSRQ